MLGTTWMIGLSLRLAARGDFNVTKADFFYVLHHKQALVTAH
jgi:hypothetical protein